MQIVGVAMGGMPQFQEPFSRNSVAAHFSFRAILPDAFLICANLLSMSLTIKPGSNRSKSIKGRH
jgi:hypothetical protein